MSPSGGDKWRFISIGSWWIWIFWMDWNHPSGGILGWVYHCLSDKFITCSDSTTFCWFLLLIFYLLRLLSAIALAKGLVSWYLLFCGCHAEVVNAPTHRLRRANLATLWSCTRTLVPWEWTALSRAIILSQHMKLGTYIYIDLKADQKWWVLLLSMAGISADVRLMLELWSRSSFSQTAKISEATPVIIADESGHVTDVTSNTGSHWEQPVVQHGLASALEQAPRLKTSWCRVQKSHEKNTYSKMRPIREQWVCGHQLNCWRSFKNIIMIQNVGCAIAEPSLSHRCVWIYGTQILPTISN